MSSLTFVANDGATLAFGVPPKVNRYLVTKAIQRAHQGNDAELVSFGLTRAETEFVAEVVAKLEEHRRPVEAAQ